MVLGTGVCLAPGLETVNEHGVKWCTSGVRDLRDFSGVGQVLRCWGTGFFQESLKWDGRKM